MVMELDAKQQEAVNVCFDTKARITAVSGEAGTGKTTIMRNVYDGFRQQGYKCALAAPTGKAAKRIYEATGIHAMTVHRLLEYTHPGEEDPKTGKPFGYSFPRRDRTNRLEYDVVFVDEYMMMSEELHRNVIDALPRGGLLRCFGDMHQLPPVENNQNSGEPPFMQVINNKDLPSVELEENYRVKEGDIILDNARSIRRGRSPKRTETTPLTITTQIAQEVENIVMDCLENGVSFGDIQNQVISPTNKTWIGVGKLNQRLQMIFMPNAQSDGVPLPRFEYAQKTFGTPYIMPGDKVVVTQNLYDLRPFEERYEEITDEDVLGQPKFIPPQPQHQVFNGEVGIVSDLEQDGSVWIDLQDRTVKIASMLEVITKDQRVTMIDPRKHIDLAYALTTHKMQGSEVDSVIYVMGRSASWILSRRNLYTAYTRARKYVHVVSDQPSLSQALFNRDARGFSKGKK